jgi:hypothetical protein
MLHLLKHFTTLAMTRTLLLLFPLLFVGGCEARNATSIQSSHSEINTFFGQLHFLKEVGHILDLIQVIEKNVIYPCLRIQIKRLKIYLYIIYNIYIYIYILYN